jgi:hypothetical protein
MKGVARHIKVIGFVALNKLNARTTLLTIFGIQLTGYTLELFKIVWLLAWLC